MSGAKSWFSRYPVLRPTLLTRSTTFFASATLRASGFSQARPRRVPAPLFMASTISSTFAMRAWLGPHSHSALMAGSATMSRMVLYGRASPTSSSRANAAVDAAFFSLGLQTPRTSISRTVVSDWMWKRALKPLPTKPMPSRSGVMSFAEKVLDERSIRSQAEFAAVEFGVADAKLLQSFGRAPVPVGRKDVSHVAKILYADLARPESACCEIAKSVEEAHAVRHA